MRDKYALNATDSENRSEEKESLKIVRCCLLPWDLVFYY